MNFVLYLQVIGFVYGLIIEQFGWTVYIVLAGFALSCVVSFILIALHTDGYEVDTLCTQEKVTICRQHVLTF